MWVPGPRLKKSSVISGITAKNISWSCFHWPLKWSKQLFSKRVRILLNIKQLQVRRQARRNQSSPSAIDGYTSSNSSSMMGKMFCTTLKELKKSNQIAAIGTTNFRRSTFDPHGDSRKHCGAVLHRSMTQATEKATSEKETAICQPWGQCTS